MAFFICEDQKQHINLSNHAWAKVENDMHVFFVDSDKKINRSGFFNAVFAHYYEISRATISRRLSESRRHYDKVLGKVVPPLGETERKRLLKVLVDDILDTLLFENKNYPKGQGCKVRLNNDNYEYLTQDSVEDQYYDGSSGAYLKSLFEDYARLPFYRREQVFFQDIMEEVKTAIKEKKRIKLQLRNGKKFYVSPVQFALDPTGSFNYLVGYTDDNLVSFRLSKIYKANIRRSQSGFLSKEKIQEAEKTVYDQGPQFLAGELQDVVVELTDKGIEKYRNQIHLRPECHRIENDRIYYFRCTQLQALFYFFKFGRDVTILSPQDLRDRFVRYYEQALENYRN